MSASQVTEAAEKALKEKNYDVIIINYANCDMVGHTGKFDAVVKAVETVDIALARLVPQAIEKGYHLIITADHGNAEQMLDENDNVMTAHSMNEVPMILISRAQAGNGKKLINLSNGKLGDIAPTLLNLMKISVPKEMTGVNLMNNL